MKKLILFLLFLAFIASSSSAKMPTIIVGGGVEGGAAGGQSFSYDFSEKDTLEDWYNLDDEVACSGTTCDAATLDTVNDELDVNGAVVLIYELGTTDTLSQYGALKLTDSNPWVGPMLRASQEGDTEYSYTVRLNSTTDMRLRVCLSSSCSDIDSATSPSFDDADSLGFEVSGTGTSTIFKAWHWDEQSPPSRGSWGTCDNGFIICNGSGDPYGCCTGSGTGSGCAETGCSAEAVAAPPDNYANDGNYVGIYRGGISGNVIVDDWMSGDI